MNNPEANNSAVFPWPLPYGLAFILFALLSLLSANPLEWIFASGVFVLGVREILHVNVLPIHLAFAFPFLEIVTSLADAEVNGVGVNEYFYGHGSEVYSYSLAALCLVYIGWKWQVRKVHVGRISEVENELWRLSVPRLIALYFVFQGLQLFTDFIIPYGSSVKQLERHIVVLGTIVFTIFVWRFKTVRGSNKEKLLSVGFIGFVLISSLSSFFSGWKAIFIVSTFALVIQSNTPTLRVLRNLGIVFGIGVLFVLTWQGVKSEYRNFLNGGSRQQVVLVSQQEGISKLLELTKRFWFEEASESQKSEWYSVTSSDEAFQSALERVGYLDLFARMRQYVPSELPHENGALLRDNLTFALIPRIFNPNKGVKNDQLKVEKYAKRNIADNASFSLGHYAEHYIDFGKFGMLISLFVFGSIGGMLTRIVLKGTGFMRAVDGAFCFYWLQMFLSFQFDAIKIYGLVFWALLTYVFLWRRIIEQVLNWANKS